MRVVHLSDLHLSQQLGPDAEGVDVRLVLVGLLHDCRRLTDVDLVVVSGDIADDGSPEAYDDALALVTDFAGKHGAAQVWATGNHDDRAAFSAVLGSGHLDPTGRDVGHLCPSAIGERAAVSDVQGLRVITVDSLVPGQVAGRVSGEQLIWLQEVLTHPAPAGSLLVLHHPPISVSPSWAAASLQNTGELAAVLAGSSVLAVLCGHVHAQIAGTFAGVPVWVGPGVITRIDLTAPTGVVRAVRGAAATVVDLGGPSSPLFHIVHARDPRAGEQVYLASGRTWQYLDVEDEHAPDDA